LSLSNMLSIFDRPCFELRKNQIDGAKMECLGKEND
jgi:hypothetical protein